jgi:5-methylcytosine-specific restriction endonuclease McrA
MPLTAGGYYNLKQWLQARAQALHDAEWQCQRCGASLVNKGREAHVHHRKPLLRAPALATEPLNLMALCSACHTREHAIEKKIVKVVCNVDGTPNDPNHPWYKV